MSATLVKPPADKALWQARFVRSGYFLGAVLLHLALFVMLATWIVFKAPVVHDDTATFLPAAAKPPPPPAPPPPAGGDAVNNFEPTVQVTPPPVAPSMVTTTAPSSFSVNSVKVSIPNMPASIAPPAGSGLSGHSAPGQASGAGTPFGSSDSSGAPEFQGFLYDLKQTRDHADTGMDPGMFHNKISQFVAANWNADLLRTYYKSPKPLNTTSIFIPVINAADGPKAFGVQNEVKPNMYVVWYKVSAAPQQEGTYHFVGVGDDILVVRVNGKTVLDGCDFAVDDELRKKEKSINMTNFNPTFGGNADFWIGTPFHVSAGENADIDVLIGEEPGGKSDYFLYIQRDQDTYQTQSNGSPLLPIFQLDPNPIKPSGEDKSYPPFATTPEPWTAAARSDDLSNDGN
jgi:hypothetical protein